MNCPHCGSNYTNLSRRETSEKETCEIYVCESCKKTFKRVVSSWNKSANGKYLMRINGGTFTYNGDLQEYAEVYELEDGSLQIKTFSPKYVDDGKNQYGVKMSKVGGVNRFVRTIKPKFEISFLSGKLNFSSYTWPNDPQGTIFAVRSIKMNNELTKRALSNEAMRLSYSQGKGVFVINGIVNEERLKDVHRYLNGILAPYTSKQEEKKSSGCYIATAVYGSYDCPEVWTLRRFRDFDLAETWYGRLFIKTYYSISPTLVSWFGNKQWFKSIWRSVLDRMVTNLNEKGVENTPYEDRNW